MKMRVGMQIVLALLLSLMTTAHVYAQATAANATGRVTGTDGQGLEGVSVELVHVPSGTRSRTTTDADGRWSARGLRVGGPYTVSASREGLQTVVQEDIFFLLGETGTINLTLERTADLGRVVVTGVALSDVFDPMKMGAGTNVTRQQIEALPSISRNIQDYIRTDPRISQVDKDRGEISAGGQNTRFNNIRIDGVTTNDAFGLEANNLPTDRQPISIDSIQEINISLANFDVALAGYTGASVDAVTKSGTNEFEGTAYYIYRDNDWVGKRDGNKFTGFEDETTYGVTLGGPIVKDTLFFFAAFEKFERSAQAPVFGPAGSNAAQIVSGISTADIARIQQIAREVWGFDAGSFDPPSSLDTDIKDFLIKLDWNIADNHRASLRYNRTEQTDPFLRQIGPRSLSLSSFWHNNDKKFEALVAQVFSDWTDTFSTEFKASRSKQESTWDNFSRLPQIRICLNSPQNTCASADTVFLGTEQFRHVNILEVETTNLFGAANWFLGNHEIKVGFDWQSQDIFNLFGRDQFGVYDFYGIDAFAAGTPGFFTVRYPTQGDVNSVAAQWELRNLGLFLQDTWSVNYNLTVTAGLRVDIADVPDRPVFNQVASERFGLRNDNTIDGQKVWQPRLGFNYSFDTERRTQLRGGVGLFQGAAANVWLSNPFTNNGVTLGVFTATNPAAAGITFSPNPDNQPGPRPTGGFGPVDWVADDVKQPTVWKLNLAVDHELPWWGLIGTAELLLTDVHNGIYYEKPSLTPRGTLPDGRAHYWTTVTRGQWTGAAAQRPLADPRFDIDNTIARRTTKGKGQQLTLSLQKPQTENWFWNVAYTYTYATEVNPLTSSQAASNWNNAVRVDRSANISERSIYAIRDRFTASIGYQEFFFSDLKTSVAAFYEGRSGRPFSYTFINDLNGDARSGVDLFYVPSGPGDVLFTGGEAMEAAFFDFLRRNPGLARYAGGIARANGERSPWAHNIDLRISQELPGFWRGKSEVWMDVINFGNLINKRWGQIREVGFPYNLGIASFAGVDPATGRYVYTFNEAQVRDLTLRDNRGESRWAIQLGFRYKF
jgi:outer membrane receptor protein involved in Fe transport